MFCDFLLRRAVRLIERVSRVPLLVVLVSVSFLIPVVLFPLHGVADTRLLDLRLSYNPDQVYGVLAALGAEGRSAYLGMALSSDLVFPLIYSSALSVALMLVLRELFSSTSHFRCIVLLPFLVAFADWCENLSLSRVVLAVPERLDGLARFAGIATTLKWSLLGLTLLILFLAAGYRVVGCYRRR